ncbi:MAG: PAS domain S-box protein, partial [Desulfobacteraceae bacterium]|nr:PAS domain S-box protein [Desulfobacteraceae bacterium]
MSKEGIELYSPVPGHTGKSVFENCKDFPTVISMANEMVKRGHGTTTYLFNRVWDKQQGIIKKHAVYMPIKVGDSFWSIVVTSSEDEVLASLVSFKNKLGFLIGLFLVSMAIFSYYGMKAWGIVQESAKRKKIEQALQESEQRYRGILEGAAEAILIADIQTKEFLYANQAICKTLGYTEKELIGKTLKDIHPGEDLEYVISEFESQARGEKTLAANIPCLRKDGTILYANINTSMALINGKECNLGFFTDITERKRLEEELLRAQKLESMGVLAGGLAHDFNNILTIIFGNVTMAKTQVAPEDEIFEMLSEAETASKRAQALTKQLLTFAKGGAPVKETASIKDILKESSAFVLRGSKSGCEFSITEDLWPAEIDVGQISQVINNIVINANQAMPKGGTIQVAAENLTIDDRHGLPLKPGRYIRISVTDQGVGIAQKHLLNIFDPYFTTKQAGSGLGLATTYSIIKKHEGHIAVESQLGIGTTFDIYLPASDKIVPEKEEVLLIKGQGRILVMDDEASLRKMLGRMLKNLGYESEFAKDGAEAIRMIQEA